VSDDRYLISQSGAVSDQLRGVFARAKREGLGAVTAAAARWMVEEMERTPFEFGESREYWPHADLHTRIAFVDPLYVLFGIHQTTRTVFVGRIAWLKRG
jgi:hypothetical protein